MKTIKIQTKWLILCTVLLLSINLYSQSSIKTQNLFVRVYSLKGESINKGHIVFANDSVLRLRRGKKFINIKIKNIWQVKTKRSVGQSVVTTSLIGGVAGSVIGLATSKEETRSRTVPIIGQYEYTTGTSSGTGAVIGGGIGLAGGALIGLGGSLFKKSQTFIINGRLERWQLFKNWITAN